MNQAGGIPPGPTRRGFLAGAGAALLAGGWLGASGCSGPALPSALLGAEPPPARFTVNGSAGIDAVTHVLNRCGFGPRPGDRDALLALAGDPETAIDAWLERQLHPEAIDDAACTRALARFPGLAEPAGELYEYQAGDLLRELVSATVLRATLSRRQLHEAMVELWSDHFNIDMSKGDCAWLKVADDRQVVRRHALGRFRDLLGASALSPAMLWYLDGRVNVSGGDGRRANENYARELLELHTLGVHGGYSQQDVMEVARCLTGWTVRPRQGFRKWLVEFDPARHDGGAKRVLGVDLPAGLGAQDIARVLDVVAAHPATAQRIAGVLCRRFIAEQPPAAAVAAVAAAFTASQGDIRATLRALFAHPGFRADEPGVRGGKLKRPFHVLVSALRATDATSDARPALTDCLTRMGHAPFQYPTPDGYPDQAAAWRDGLLWRWNLASALAGNAIPGTRIDLDALTRRAGGSDGLRAHLLGRLPSATEQAALDGAASGHSTLALLLAAPAFQRC